MTMTEIHINHFKSATKVPPSQKVLHWDWHSTTTSFLSPRGCQPSWAHLEVWEGVRGTITKWLMCCVWHNPKLGKWEKGIQNSVGMPSHPHQQGGRGHLLQPPLHLLTERRTDGCLILASNEIWACLRKRVFRSPPAKWKILSGFLHPCVPSSSAQRKQDFAYHSLHFFWAPS